MGRAHKCARCGGPTHRLPPEADWRPFAPSGFRLTRVSHWCVPCMAEEWPYSAIDERYAIVWKLVRREPDRPPPYPRRPSAGVDEAGDPEDALGWLALWLSRPQRGSETRFRGLMGAPYRLGFPAVLLGAGNFLLSPLGALKEFENLRGFAHSPTGWAVLAAVVPWRHLALRPDLVLDAGAFTPYLPLVAHKLEALAEQGLTPSKARRLLDELPDEGAGLAVEAWEARLRPELPDWWLRRVRAGEALARGLAALADLKLEVYLPLVPTAETLPERLKLFRPVPERVRARSRARLVRFLGRLVGALFRQPGLEARYRQARAAWRRVDRDLYEGRFDRLGSWRHWPQLMGLARRLALGGALGVALPTSIDTETAPAPQGPGTGWRWFDPWLELESLMEALRDEDVELWVEALEQAGQTLDDSAPS